MSYFKRVSTVVREIATQYPAIVSGLVMYSYLLFMIIRLFIRAHAEGFSYIEVLESFDALPFMWLLSISLVKIIGFRSRLHESERQRLLAEEEARLHQTQVTTLREVVKALQHHINNPLAIISLAARTAAKNAAEHPTILHQLELIQNSGERIEDVLKKLSETVTYSVETPNAYVGPMTKL